MALATAFRQRFSISLEGCGRLLTVVVAAAVLMVVWSHLGDMAVSDIVAIGSNGELVAIEVVEVEAGAFRIEGSCCVSLRW